MTQPSSNSTRPSAAHFLVGAAVTGLAISLAHPSATRQLTWPWILLLTLTWLVPCGAWLHRLILPSPIARPNRLLTGGLLGLVAAGLLSAGMSPYAAHSFTRLWPTGAGVALFFWLHDWLAAADAAERSLRLRRLITGLALTGAILASLSVLGWLWLGQGVNWAYRNEFPFGHSTYTAGAMILIIPWLALAAGTARGALRFGWIVALASALFVLIVTGSRGGVLALGVITMLTVGYVTVRAPWPRRHKITLLVATLLALALGVWTNPRLRDLAQGRGWSEAARESNAQRSAMLDGGLKLGALRPWIGWGPGTVPLIYPQVRGQLRGGVDNVLQLHSTPAQVWAALGVAGLAALLALFTATLRRVVQTCRHTSTPAVTLIAAVTVLGYGVFALTDHQLDLPAMNALLVIALVLLFAGDKAIPSPWTLRTRRGLFLASTGLVLALLLPTARDLAARFTYDLALTAFEHNEPTDGARLLRRAATLAPYDPYYRHQLAGRLLAQRQTTTEAGTFAALTKEAVQELEQSLHARCFQEYAHFTLGWLALEQADPAAAMSHLLAVAREAPQRRGLYFGLGQSLQKQGDVAAAARAYALEWINDPLSSTDIAWSEPALGPLRPQVFREAQTLLAKLEDQPTALYLQALWSWWSAGGEPPRQGFNPASTALWSMLATPTSAPDDQTPDKALTQLLRAWRQSPEAIAHALSGQPATASWTEAMAQRARKYPAPDLHGFLTAPVATDSPLARLQGFNRHGYGVLAQHPDGFMLTDLYLRQQNLFATTYLSTLFPAKGWLPAPQLLKLLDARPLPGH